MFKFLFKLTKLTPFSRLFKSSLFKKIFLNVSWALLGKLFNMIGTLLMGIFIARYLGVEKYGLYRYVIAFVTISSVLAIFGTDNIIIRELSKNRLSNLTTMGSSFFLRLTTSILTIIIVNVFAIFYEADKLTIILINIYSLSLLSIPIDVLSVYFKSILKNEFIVKAEIIRTITTLIIKILLIVFEFNIIWFISISVADILLPSLLCLYFFKKYKFLVGKWKASLKYVIFLGKESIPLLGSSIAAIISLQADQILLKNYLNNEAVAQYAVAYNFLSVILFLPQIVGITFAPILVEFKNQSISKFNENMQLFSDFVFWGTFLISGFVCLISTWLVPLLYGVEYSVAGEILTILVWKCIFVSMGVVSGYWIVINGKQILLFYRDTLGCLINIVTNIFLIPKIGVFGAVWSALISYSVATYFSHYFILPLNSVLKIQNITIFRGLVNIKEFLIKK